MAWIDIERGDHRVTGVRYNRGSKSWGHGGGQQYVGYTLTCTCGWTTRINANKRESLPYARDHLRTHDEDQ